MTETSPTAGKRLLVIDDELIQRLIVRRVGESVGFGVDDAASFEHATRWLASRRYDAIVIDLSLGEHDGVEVLREIAARSVVANIIFITGFDDRVRHAASRLAAAQGLSVAGTLRKPIAPDRLRDLLTITLDRGARARETEPMEITAADLAAAIAAGEVMPAFQPKIELASDLAIGVEALARWQSPKFGTVMPDIFIGIAEGNGLIGSLTQSILRQSLAACAKWRVTHPGVTVAVNLSPLVLDDINLPDVIEALLQQAGVPPGSLVLEVTESTTASNDIAAADTLTRLRIKGIQLSIDDFGTGHSSLLSLLRLPYGELKIDRSFITACDQDADAWKIVRATLSLAREFGMRVVAEGIESPTVERMLREAGCEVAQGWWYARAMPADKLIEWLAARAPRRRT